MHVPFMFIFYKAITLRLPGHFIDSHLDLLNRPVRLKLALDLGLAGVVIDTTHEESFERVGGGFLLGSGVP